MRLFGLHIHRRDRPWDEAPPWAIELCEMMRLVINITETYTMATQATLARMQASVQANTDATKAAADALTHYAQTNADLTAQLKEAIANDDDAAISAAADALDKNNADLLAGVPATAAAVTANTPAA